MVLVEHLNWKHEKHGLEALSKYINLIALQIVNGDQSDRMETLPFVQNVKCL
jgi:hypothetical protein